MPKATNLIEAYNKLDKDRFLITNYSIREELDVSDFDFRDFFTSMALKIYDTAEKEVELERDIKEDFKHSQRRIRQGFWRFMIKRRQGIEI